MEKCMYDMCMYNAFHISRNIDLRCEEKDSITHSKSIVSRINFAANSR